MKILLLISIIILIMAIVDLMVAIRDLCKRLDKTKSESTLKITESKLDLDDVIKVLED